VVVDETLIAKRFYRLRHGAGSRFDAPRGFTYCDGRSRVEEYVDGGRECDATRQGGWLGRVAAEAAGRDINANARSAEKEVATQVEPTLARFAQQSARAFHDAVANKDENRHADGVSRAVSLEQLHRTRPVDKRVALHLDRHDPAVDIDHEVGRLARGNGLRVQMRGRQSFG
jgi:hypothetical protein